MHTIHHTVPRSRGGRKDIVKLPKAFHDAWHTIFENLYDEEAEVFIREVNLMMIYQPRISNKELHELREKIKGRWRCAY